MLFDPNKEKQPLSPEIAGNGKQFVYDAVKLANKKIYFPIGFRYEDPKKDVTTNIALKAVASRKANALAKKRHNAAVKAWETRRAEATALAEKRHNAAVKAWETRRNAG